MKALGRNLIIKQNDDTDQYHDKVIFESNRQYTRNCGTVIFAPEGEEIEVGDVAHFSDMAGVYIDKKLYPFILTMDIEQVVAVTPNNDNDVFVGEDMRYYLLRHIGAAQRTNDVYH